MFAVKLLVADGPPLTTGLGAGAGATATIPNPELPPLGFADMVIATVYGAPAAGVAVLGTAVTVETFPVSLA
jgi:hypothetical protein